MKPEVKIQCWQIRAAIPQPSKGYDKNVYIGVLANTVEEAIEKFRKEYSDALIDSVVQHYNIHIL